MKLVWCPDTASTAYMDAVDALTAAADTDVAELVAAMAGGWKTKCIVEAWHPDGGAASASTTLALSAAAARTGGRHVCVVPDDPTRARYLETVGGGGGAEVVVGAAEEVMAGIVGVDFAVVDLRRSDAERVLREARIGGRGAVLVCKLAGGEVRWSGKLMEGSRVVRSAVLPVGGGVEIVHVGVGEGKRLSDYRNSRWIKHVDRTTGEEHVFRRST